MFKTCNHSIAIMMSGLSSISSYPYSERNNLVFGISVLATVGTSLLPQDIVQGMPSLFSYLFGSAICVGALTAIITNLLIPAKKVDAPVNAEVEAEPVVN